MRCILKIEKNKLPNRLEPVDNDDTPGTILSAGRQPLAVLLWVEESLWSGSRLMSSLSPELGASRRSPGLYGDGDW